jgi:hypothetical protein
MVLLPHGADRLEDRDRSEDRHEVWTPIPGA